MTKSIVFADLDGTFLDDKYQYETTSPIVNQLAALGGSVVFCSSKTRSEIEYYRKVTGINEPFITENGGAIYIPKGYFQSSYQYPEIDCYNVIRLSEPYTIIRKKLEQIKLNTSTNVIGFGDMTLQELASETGLPLNLAKMAKKREHDEPFRIVEGNKSRIVRAIKQEGFHCTKGGRYFHITGKTDKGKAITVLKNLYRLKYGQIHTLAVGDGPNDLPMLRAVDKPFLIPKNSITSRLNTWCRMLHYITQKLPLKSADFPCFDVYNHWLASGVS